MNIYCNEWRVRALLHAFRRPNKTLIEYDHSILLALGINWPLLNHSDYNLYMINLNEFIYNYLFIIDLINRYAWGKHDCTTNIKFNCVLYWKKEKKFTSWQTHLLIYSTQSCKMWFNILMYWMDKIIKSRKTKKYQQNIS